MVVLEAGYLDGGAGTKQCVWGGARAVTGRVGGK